VRVVETTTNRRERGAAPGGCRQSTGNSEGQGVLIKTSWNVTVSRGVRPRGLTEGDLLGANECLGRQGGNIWFWPAAAVKMKKRKGEGGTKLISNKILIHPFRVFCIVAPNQRGGKGKKKPLRKRGRFKFSTGKRACRRDLRKPGGNEEGDRSLCQQAQTGQRIFLLLRESRTERGGIHRKVPGCGRQMQAKETQRVTTWGE